MPNQNTAQVKLRASVLLLSSILLTHLCQTAPALAQAGDAFCSADFSTPHDKKNEDRQRAYVRSLAARVHKRWISLGKPVLPSVLVYLQKNSYQTCVGDGHYDSRQTTPEQSLQASKLIAAAVDPTKIPDAGKFGALFKFSHFVLLKDVSPPLSASPSANELSAQKTKYPALNTTQKAAILNIEGVRLLNNNDIQSAIVRFERALAVVPDYEYARANLAIAYNNVALKMPPQQAMKYFHKAQVLAPSNQRSRESLDALIKACGKDPSKPADRLALARECLAVHDLDGAEVEFCAARNLDSCAASYIGLGDVAHARGKTKEAISQYQHATDCKVFQSDSEIGQANLKLGQLYQSTGDFGKAFACYNEALKHKSDLPSMARAIQDGYTEAVHTKQQPREASESAKAELITPVSAQSDVDFGPYMADLQRRIKRQWFPPKGNESRRVVVVFKIHAGGEVSDLRIDHSAGSEIADRAGLVAVGKAAPFMKLPAGAPDSVDIQFTFDYNVFKSQGAQQTYIVEMDHPDRVLCGEYDDLRSEFHAPWVNDFFARGVFRQF